MTLRQWLVRFFGENVARKIEEFMDGSVFGDPLVACPQCGRLSSATMIGKWKMCPVCHAPAAEQPTDELPFKQPWSH